MAGKAVHEAKARAPMVRNFLGSLTASSEVQPAKLSSPTSVRTSGKKRRVRAVQEAKPWDLTFKTGYAFSFQVTESGMMTCPMMLVLLALTSA